MRIALTGATGFVGGAVLETLLGKGIGVTALARRPPPEPAPPGVRFVAGNLASSAALDRLVADADAVIHVAGLVRTLDPAAFKAVNVDGTRALAETATRHGVRRMVFVSSLAAREPQLSRYGASKRQAEEVVRSSGLHWTIVRPPAVYGPRDAEMLELFRLAARFGVVPVPPAGRASLIHVGDLARLLVALVGAAPDPAMMEPDDGTAGGHTHGALARMIGRAVGRRRVFAPAVPAVALRLAAGIDERVRGQAARLTGDRARYMAHPDWVADPAARPPRALWQPRIGAEEGLAATARWYWDAGWL
ncbi:NAD-dependent epimerase/dehydratase family protein [Erythrobacteraceae bacterium CFH 75059]|uniref:NAD-dependent epimerase/dehydratase family protein n=1 Tax=Qipengyuania thermophila TaxID=2509361 RepID=UPI001020AB5F|nr:NAD-dependent epimerase/dehydratase family protein [Qipengyuania thermophila]TCD00648.1 NAD-dependent epimerase/dehydratase family protein [Erythrobacteraceae bacterium CFH 75059]